MVETILQRTKKVIMNLRASSSFQLLGFFSSVLKQRNEKINLAIFFFSNFLLCFCSKIFFEVKKQKRKINYISSFFYLNQVSHLNNNINNDDNNCEKRENFLFFKFSSFIFILDCIRDFLYLTGQNLVHQELKNRKDFTHIYLKNRS